MSLFEQRQSQLLTAGEKSSLKNPLNFPSQQKPLALQAAKVLTRS